VTPPPSRARSRRPEAAVLAWTVAAWAVYLWLNREPIGVVLARLLAGLG